MNTFYILQSNTGFDWMKFLLGDEDWSFLIETAFRSLVMFAIILTGLTILGKRGVKQLSIFELVVIIGLGSAAGDPMFYKDVGVLPALIVFCMIIGLYTFVTYMVGRFKPFEKLLEGRPIYLIKAGVFSIVDFEKELLAQDEFFAELRVMGVSQLGQVEEAIEEVSGEISIFFYADEQVKPGLPIMPNSLELRQTAILVTDKYSCTFCGFTQQIGPAKEHKCPTCKKKEWVVASNKKRIR